MVVSVAFFLFATSLTSHGQEEPKPVEKVSSEQESRLWQRNRQVLHTAHDPVKIRGVEEGDNDFRSRTPILEQSNREVTFVDTEELRRRKLAMFERKESFASPVPIAKPAWNHNYRSGRDTGTGANEPTTTDTETKKEGSGGVPLDIACLVTFLMIIAALFARRWLLE